MSIDFKWVLKKNLFGKINMLHLDNSETVEQLCMSHILVILNHNVFNSSNQVTYLY